MLKILINRVLQKANPIKFWKKRGLIIGEKCSIYSDVDFGSEPYLIEIGNNVRITSGVRFITHDGGVIVLRHLYNNLANIDLFGRIKIGNNCHIGINSIIMPGVTIEDNCIIGCGTIVTKNVPSNSVCVGVPGRVIETIEDYKNKHQNVFLHTKSLSAKEKRIFLDNIFYNK